MNPKVLFGADGTLNTLSYRGRTWIPSPKIVGEKIRGGMPVCLPFGWNAGLLSQDLPNHGLLRNRVVDGLSNSGHSFTFKHSNILYDTSHGSWQVNAALSYTFIKHGIALRGLFAADSVTHEKKTMPSNICFHPYFSTPSKTEPVKIKTGITTIEVNNEDCMNHTDVYPISVQNNEALVTMVIPKLGIISMKLKGFTHIAVWTDSAEYLCVEPMQTHPDAFMTDDGVVLSEQQTEVGCEFTFRLPDFTLMM